MAYKLMFKMSARLVNWISHSDKNGEGYRAQKIRFSRSRSFKRRVWYHSIEKNMQKKMIRMGNRTHDPEYLRFIDKRANHSAISQVVKSL